MKTIIRLSVLTCCLVAMLSCGNDVDDPPQEKNENLNCNNTAQHGAVVGRLEFPRLKDGSNNILIKHNASFGVNYCVEWDSNLRPEGWNWSNDGGTLRSQRWSCWQWHAGNSSSDTSRKPYNNSGVAFSEYPNNPYLDSQYHFTADPYWNTGYQHGHVMASADRGYGYNQQANIQTFYMTNMQPQIGGFNSKVWATMEYQARAWNNKNFRDTLYVVKGGTIDKRENIITTLGSGRNRIPVPKYFFMALLCKNKDTSNGGYKALGFWIEHKASDATDLTPYVVNIRTLEQLTGIDFFCNLPDNIENAVETLSRDNVMSAWNLK